MPIVIPGSTPSLDYEDELVLQILDSDGNVAYDLNDGVTTYVSPEGFDPGTPELEDSYFHPSNADGGRLTRKRLRPCEMGWSQHIITDSVETARSEVAKIARLLREGPELKYQHNGEAEVRYIDTLSLSALPSWLQGSFGIPAQYVTVTNRVEAMPIRLLRQPTMRGEELDSDTNKLKNSTLLWQGATAGRPGLWAWESTSDIANEQFSATETGPLDGWTGAWRFDASTNAARRFWQKTGAATAAPGDIWTCSVYAKASSSNAKIRCRVLWYDNADAFISTDEGGAALTTLTDEWQRVEFTSSAAPANTDRVRYEVVVDNDDSSTTTIYLAAAQLEEAASATTYRSD